MAMHLLNTSHRWSLWRLHSSKSTSFPMRLSSSVSSPSSVSIHSDSSTCGALSRSASVANVSTLATLSHRSRFCALIAPRNCKAGS